MKLSEAIRAGNTLIDGVPRSYFTYMDLRASRDKPLQVTGACPLGKAFLGAAAVRSTYSERFMIALNKRAEDEVAELVTHALNVMFPYLNQSCATFPNLRTPAKEINVAPRTRSQPVSIGGLGYESLFGWCTRAYRSGRSSAEIAACLEVAGL